MAKIKLGAIVTDISGKLGGHVFSKNSGGAYVRTKSTPSNPQTVFQQENRAVLGFLAQNWSILTDAQRASFNTAVADWKGTNIFGDTTTLSGKALYTRLNKNLISSGLAPIVTAPAKVQLPIVAFESATIDLSSQTIAIATSSSADGFMLQISASPKMTAGTSFSKNRTRVLANVLNEDLNSADLWNVYVARFGTPTLNDNIVFEVKLIADNGQTSVAEKHKSTIQA